MNKYRRKWLWAQALIGFLLISFAPCQAAERYFITWGTTSPVSVVYSYYGVLAKVLSEEYPEFNVTLRATGASVENTKLLQKGQVEFGGADSKTMWEARNGEGPFKGSPYLDARVIYPIAVSPLQFCVSEASGVKDVYGLEGKPFTPGQRGASSEVATMDVFRILGVQPKIRYSSWADAVEAMKDKRIVGFSKYGAPDAMFLEVASVMKIRFLSFSDADIKKIVENTVGLRKGSVPAGTYSGIGEFHTVTNEYLEYARKDIPDDVVYKIVKAVWKHRATLKKGYPAMPGDKSPEITLATTTCPMHPGAIKWYREMGYTVPKILYPLEWKE